MENAELKKWREGAKLTQAQLAERLGVKENTVYRWETGRLPISKTVQVALEQIKRSEKVKKFVESSSTGEVLKNIRFDFNSVNAWNGYLETHLSDGYVSIETALDTEKLKGEGLEISDNAELRKAAFEQFKTILGLENPKKEIQE